MAPAEGSEPSPPPPPPAPPPAASAAAAPASASAAASMASYDPSARRAIMQRAVTRTPATPKYDAVPRGAREGRRQSGVRTEAAQPKRTAVLETSAAGSAKSAASRSVPVSAMTVAQAIAAVEQSRSEATAGKAASRGPRVEVQAPTYEGCSVSTQTRPIRRKLHALRAPKRRRRGTARAIASAGVAPESVRRATPAGSVSTPVPTMFFIRATVHCDSLALGLATATTAEDDLSSGERSSVMASAMTMGRPEQGRR
mmetsp:Transcript_36884/g.119012  ORF Transcript_36884/g.119012 Transcript_36884/m.119012 type:complete len:256 (-) Transcript_36884:94-861(-)